MKVCKIIAKVLLIIGIVIGACVAFGAIISGVAGIVIASVDPGGIIAKIVAEFNASVTDPELQLTAEAVSTLIVICSVYCFLMVPFSAATIIVSSIGLKKLDDAKKKGDTLAIGILNCIFGVTAAGALLIVVSCLLPSEEETKVVEAQ